MCIAKNYYIPYIVFVGFVNLNSLQQESASAVYLFYCICCGISNKLKTTVLFSLNNVVRNYKKGIVFNFDSSHENRSQIEQFTLIHVSSIFYSLLLKQNTTNIVTFVL